MGLKYEKATESKLFCLAPVSIVSVFGFGAMLEGLEFLLQFDSKTFHSSTGSVLRNLIYRFYFYLSFSLSLVVNFVRMQF